MVPRSSRILSALLGAAAVMALSGCGWRLRGEIQVPPQLQESCLVGVAPYSDLGSELRSTLNRAGAKVVECTVAKAQLRIAKNDLRKRVVSVDSAGRASEYELMYEVSFSVVDNNGEVLVPSQSVQLTRSFSYDPNNVLAKGEEEKNIRQDLVRFAVRQIMQRIEASTKQQPGSSS
jgi:LPS-assembly lipoprotein